MYKNIALDKWFLTTKIVYKYHTLKFVYCSAVSHGKFSVGTQLNLFSKSI